MKYTTTLLPKANKTYLQLHELSTFENAVENSPGCTFEVCYGLA